MGIEIMEQVDEKIDAILVPTGGAGLIAGLAVAIKYLNPKVLIIVRTIKSDLTIIMFQLVL